MFPPIVLSVKGLLGLGELVCERLCTGALCLAPTQTAARISHTWASIIASVSLPCVSLTPDALELGSMAAVDAKQTFLGLRGM
jgi:hypothetical protein